MSDWSENPNVSEQTYNAVQWGKKLERERIIALLEDLAVQHWERWKHVTHDIRDEGASDAIEAAIALIEGETE